MPVPFYLNYIALTHLAFSIVVLSLFLLVFWNRSKILLDWSVIAYFGSQSVFGVLSFLGAVYLVHGNTILLVTLPIRIISYLALISFAFQLGGEKTAGNYRKIQALFVILLGAAIMVALWSYRMSNAAAPAPALIIAPAYLPGLFEILVIVIGGLLVSILSIQRSNTSRVVPTLKGLDLRGVLTSLFYPAHPDAVVLRGMLICFLISLLPGIASILPAAGWVSPEIAVYIRDIGSLLVVLVVFITYMNQAQRPSSINNKLMAISLTLVMVIFILVAAHENSLINNQIGGMRALQIQAMRYTMDGEIPELLPDDITYLAYRSNSMPELPSAYKFVYLASSSIDTTDIIRDNPDNNRNGKLELENIVNADYLQHFKDITLNVRHGLNKSNQRVDYISYRFEENARTFEAGFSTASHLEMVHKHALYLLFLYMIYSVVILFVLPIFYRTYLIKPLEMLLSGVRQAQSGNLKIMLPAQFEDEIGILTHAFNDMINTIRLAQGELRQINEELEERVRLRTAELAESEERYRHLATIDPLTGLYNRRYFYEKAGQEILRAARYGKPIAAMMLDIDHFKKVNDTYGHAAGDVVLREVAVCCQQNVRQVDIVARYGGEEFVVFLPESNLDNAQLAAERIRQAVAALVIRHPEEEKDIQVTISIGLADYTEERKTLEQILSGADQALYQSKQNGRNRVTCFTSSMQ